MTEAQGVCRRRSIARCTSGEAMAGGLRLQGIDGDRCQRVLVAISCARARISERRAPSAFPWTDRGVDVSRANQE